jgi:glycosyltransferase involved in cell wall biosynthesis
LDTRVQRRQIELAKLYGIGGFCFYFYWFAGKRLLETPVENYLDDDTLDFPFCLCWANENWSRRWDGLDSEILIAQDHSPDDDIAFIREVARYFRDRRYIRVGGRPLLVVYRPSLLPAAAETSNRWRKWCRENGIGEIFLVCTQSFDTVDPATFGFDAAVEFPPNNTAPPRYDVQAPADFQGTVYDWRIFPLRSGQYATPAYPLFRSVCPSWDNTARRKNKGTILFGSTPKLYSQWLVNAVADTTARFEKPDERLVFVNAWNEWAEGAYLEPDGRYGYAYLQATRDALEESARRRRRIVVVTHDAHPHGAQFNLLAIAKHLRDDLGFEVDIISLGGGLLLDDFSEIGTLAVIDLAAVSRQEAVERLRALRMQGADIAISSTAVSGSIVPLLSEVGFRIVSLIHEMPGILNSYGLLEQSLDIARHSQAVVFPADIVRRGFEGFIGRPVEKAKIRPQGLYLRNRVSAADEREKIRTAVRAELKLAAGSRIVLSVGYGDHRKGMDLFVDAIIEASRRDPTIAGVWVGHADDRLLSAQVERIRNAGLSENFRFTGRTPDPRRFYSAADIFALTSREDPFPSVVMEALDAGLAVVAFKGAGGFETLLSRGCGVLVDAFDAAAMAAEINSLLADRDRAVRIVKTGQAIIDTEFSFRHYVFDLLEFAGKPEIKISVVVPNYNYARFIEDRLRTIAGQTHPIFELIVLDDGSTDGSQEVIETALKTVEIPHVFIRNATNSGSVIHQWRRGVEEARGDLVWIAEADDLSDPHFLERVVKPFRAPDTVMSYCQSRQMAVDGTIQADHYLDYVSDVDPNKWSSSYSVSGYDEITSALYLKNTVPNVSAVLFKRDALLRALATHGEEIASFRNAGDWITYIRVLENGGRIAFCPSPLNAHRRHHASVTLSSFEISQLREIVHVQRDTIRRFALGQDAAARADAYAQTLYEQFGLATAEYPRFHQHPDIAGREENKSLPTEESWSREGMAV